MKLQIQASLQITDNLFFFKEEILTSHSTLNFYCLYSNISTVNGSEIKAWFKGALIEWTRSALRREVLSQVEINKYLHLICCLEFQQHLLISSKTFKIWYRTNLYIFLSRKKKTNIHEHTHTHKGNQFRLLLPAWKFISGCSLWINITEEDWIEPLLFYLLKARGKLTVAASGRELNWPIMKGKSIVCFNKILSWNWSVETGIKEWKKLLKKQYLCSCKQYSICTRNLVDVIKYSCRWLQLYKILWSFADFSITCNCQGP